MIRTDLRGMYVAMPSLLVHTCTSNIAEKEAVHVTIGVFVAVVVVIVVAHRAHDRVEQSFPNVLAAESRQQWVEMRVITSWLDVSTAILC